MNKNPIGFRFTGRNPRPARGEDILTLIQLRYYLRRFWTYREYGVCHIRGGRAAFLRWCGPRLAAHIQAKILQNPISDWLGADLQRQLSRKVLQVLRGEIIFVPDEKGGATFKPMLGAPEPPIPGEPPFKDHSFRWRWTAIGPKIDRL